MRKHDEVETIRLPLYGRGGEIDAYALVDPEDYARFCHLRWTRKNGYAFNVRQRGHRNNATYVRTYLHRAVLGLMKGDGLEVDHINRDKLDDRRSNLRVVGRSENMRNVEAWAASGYRSVYWKKDRHRWFAAVYWGGTTHHLGSFDEKIDAVAAVAEFWRTVALGWLDV